MFVVEDNGPGIRPEDRERVFEPYFTTKDEGTGLGLSIVKRIVSDHRGQIDVAASSLGGASVRVSLPANDASTETRPQP
jgi:two-component system nitrogen regulation sensor histidine kinase NtrY